MNCPSLNELPAPPHGRVGWPWTEESTSPSDAAADRWPVISVITPSYNQASFLEETIRSILLQGYPKLEYFIMDGGSTDGSVEIIKTYSPWLSYWVSQPDAGQSGAINRGLRRATGQFATWINSDDMLCKNALIEQATQIGFRANTVYAGICKYIDKSGKFLSSHCGHVHTLEDLLSVGSIWRSGGQITQPEVLFPRDLALSVGGLNGDNHYTMDYELWGKLLVAGASVQYTQIPFGIFREHPGQKSHDPLTVTDSLLKAAAGLIRAAECISEEKKREHLADLDVYKAEYENKYWQGTGRLARVRLPRGIVTRLRNFKSIYKSI